QLRRELMQEAWGRSERRRRKGGGASWRALFTPPGFAWAGAVAGVVMIALVVVALSHGPGRDGTVYVTYNVDPIHPVAAVQPIEVKFSQPMDPTSTQAAVQITPATQVNFQWTDPTTLKITPASGSFAPNTQYTVNIAPTVAKTATGAALAVGWSADKPEYVTDSSVVTPTGEVKLDHALAAGSAVALSPDGSRLWYGGHVLDLTSKKVSDWPSPPPTFLAWSPDSQRVL